MILQTSIPLEPKLTHRIDYHSKLVLLGSCFSENIGQKLAYYQLQTFQNPFGILFHPLGIERLITNAIQKKEYTEKDIFFHNERWHCFDVHSSKSMLTKEVFLSQLNQTLQNTYKQLQNASHIIITLGTSWVYRYLKTNTIVANCHKILQKEFKKEILSVDEITKSIQNIISLLQTINKKAIVIFTVSPVRHSKDGFIENQLSKSHLFAAIHRITNTENRSFYFPSYEIMMDELRDYRFYKEDMIHPNTIAIQYIWEKFQYVWMDKEAQNISVEIEKIQKGLAHKPFHPNSKEHQKFLKNLSLKKEKIQKQFPHILF
jgi:hypothetical protein